MRRDIFFAVGRKTLWLVILIIILVICIVYIDYMYHANILPDKKVDETFTQSDCTILDKKLQETGRMIHHYRADFSVSYLADGKNYISQTSANGLDRSFTTDRASEEEGLNQFVIGSTYPCWYDPAAPGIVVLVQRHSWSSTLPLLIPAVLAMIMIYYILRTLFSAAGIATNKVRDNRRNKNIK